MKSNGNRTIDLLSEQEEITLANLMIQGDAKARAQFIEANVRLVTFFAGRYRGNCRTEEDYSDIVGHGYIGLVKAVDRFDPNMGCRFSTYAEHWIAGEIRRALRGILQPIHLGPRIIANLRRALEFRDAFYDTNGYYPTTTQMAAHAGMEENDYIDAVNMYETDSLDCVLYDPDGNFTDILPQLGSDGEVLDSSGGINSDAAFRRLAEEMISVCPPRQQQIIRMHYEIGYDQCHTFEEIGKMLRMTRQNAWYNGDKSFKRKMLNDPYLRTQAEELLST